VGAFADDDHVAVLGGMNAGDQVGGVGVRHDAAPTRLGAKTTPSLAGRPGPGRPVAETPVLVVVQAGSDWETPPTVNVTAGSGTAAKSRWAGR